MGKTHHGIESYILFLSKHQRGRPCDRNLGRTARAAPPLAKVLMADKISTTVRKNTQTLNITHNGNTVFYRY